MRNKITFILLSGNGSRIRQYSSSKLALLAGALASVMVLAGVGFLVQDYLTLKHATAQVAQLNDKVAARDAEIVHQKRQIECFANEINQLKMNLVALASFEKKIRVIANLEKPAGEDNLFGVGGATPEDLDTGAPLRRDQSGLIRSMHDQIEQLESASFSQEQDFSSLLGQLEEKKNLLACTPSIRPVKGWISSRFGYRISPFTGRRELHAAYDIANREGSKIVAPADGVVTFAGKKGLYGNLMIIDHGYGLVTRYGHLKSFEAKRGTKIQRGDVIAKMGNTGRSTGPHLHYEVRLNGVPVNPEKYILN
jgi:murein DD-endopeptidase MepM/ murein hydrolase activator NlpD